MYICVSVQGVCILVQMPSEVVGSPGVTGGCEPPTQGAGNRTWVPCSTYPELLSHLSSPRHSDLVVLW